jgi:hypothetical protein
MAAVYGHPTPSGTTNLGAQARAAGDVLGGIAIAG